MAEKQKPGEAKGAPDLPPEVADAAKPDETDEVKEQAEATEETTEQRDDGTTPYDDEKTDKAIDDIVATEGDALLEAEDTATKGLNLNNEPKRGFFGRWFHNAWARWATILIVLGGIGAVFWFPTSRYGVLNAAGVRSSSSVVVVDSTTKLPLTGASITIAGYTAKTDATGKATISNLRLGPQTLAIKQVGFAGVTQKVTIGWGSNPLGTFALKAVGIQYTIHVVDYLSGQPLEGVQASSGNAGSVSGKDGKVILTLESTVVAKDAITLSKGGYRSEQMTLNPDVNVMNEAVLVLARKAVFVNKQSGKYDVYKSDLDGKNKEVLLAATGVETGNISLVTSPDGLRAALVSTRDNQRDADGKLVDALTLIDVNTAETLTIAHAPQIQLIDWVGQRLVYEQVTSDPAAKDHMAVISYNAPDATRNQLASANELSSVLSAQGAIYYSIAPNQVDGSVKEVGLFRINPDGNGRQTLLDQEVWSVLRTDYNTLTIQTPNQWYMYTFGGGATTKVSAPANLTNRLYIDNVDHTKSVWVSGSDLMSYDVASGKDTIVQSKTGLAYPAQWFGGDAIVFRISMTGETADYVASIRGGEPHKVSDVSRTYGFAVPQ